MSLCWMLLGTHSVLAEDAAGTATHEAASTAAKASTSAGLPKAAIGFSNLVIRLDVTDEIGIDRGDYRVHILEAMRRVGFNAVGAESLVFDKDRSAAADFVLGGTVRELRCARFGEGLNCSVGIDWELLDTRSDEVVYEVMSRSRALGVQVGNPKSGRRLVLSALQSLLNRPRFRVVLEARSSSGPAAPGLAPRRFLRCAAQDRPMPGDSERVLAGTAVVHSGSAMGSAFFISPSGLLLTAAHLMASPQAEVRLRDGTVHQARLLRTAANVDAALLYVPDIAQGACLGPSPPPHALGTEVYAIGTPASEELAFSLTRGIISGHRLIDGEDLLQTDASINPGNSGGPLIDSKGRAVAIVSWKVAGRGVEGLAFGVPVQTALRALRLVESSETTGALLAESGDSPVKTVNKVTDSPDPWPSLDPDADREAAIQQERLQREGRDRKPRGATPAYVELTRWGGLTLAAVGVIIVVDNASGHSNASPVFGWSALLIGSAAFLVSFPLERSASADPDPKPTDTWAALRVQGPAVQVEVGF